MSISDSLPVGDFQTIGSQGILASTAIVGAIGLTCFAVTHPGKTSEVAQRAWTAIKKSFEGCGAKDFFNGYRSWGSAVLGVGFLGPMVDRALQGSVGATTALGLSLVNLAIYEASEFYDAALKRKQIREDTLRNTVEKVGFEHIAEKVIEFDQGPAKSYFSKFTRYAVPLIAVAGLMSTIDRGLIQGPGIITNALSAFEQSSSSAAAKPLGITIFCLAIAGIDRFFQKNIFKNL